ncbi:hypothetical protein E4T56_gene9486, partial [Termitomyces sp. T112]
YESRLRRHGLRTPSPPAAPTSQGCRNSRRAHDPGTAIPRARGQTRSSTGPFKPVNLISNSIFGYCCGSFILSITKKRADSDEVARVYRYEVARGFRDDVAHLSDLISPGGEAF